MAVPFCLNFLYKSLEVHCICDKPMFFINKLLDAPEEHTLGKTRQLSFQFIQSVFDNVTATLEVCIRNMLRIQGQSFHTSP